MISNLEKITKDFPAADFVCLSQDRMPKRLGNVDVLPWQQGLRDLFDEG